MNGQISCTKCGATPLPEHLLPIETETNSYYYCSSCLKVAQNDLSMKIILNKDERRLLKNIRKFLKHEKN